MRARQGWRYGNKCGEGRRGRRCFESRRVERIEVEMLVRMRERVLGVWVKPDVVGMLRVVVGVYE